MLSWHALHVRHQTESDIAEALAGHCDTFWPHRVSRDRWKREIRRPWFPGYLFVKLDWADTAQRIRILRLNQLLAVLAVDGKPCVIPDSEIESLRILASSKARVSSHPIVTVGERVRVVSGPLTGVEGTVMRFKTSALLVVQVEMLGRAVATELDPDTIEALPRRSLRAA